PPSDAPQGVIVAPGDGAVIVSWLTEPELTYWIFYQPGDSVTAAGTGSKAVRGASSPRGVLNLVNGTKYAFVMNATHNDSAAGPSSLVVLQTPRLAGADWFPGTPLGTPPQNLKSLAFIGSRVVAVGDAATIFAGDTNYANPDPPGMAAW